MLLGYVDGRVKYFATWQRKDECSRELENSTTIFYWNYEMGYRRGSL